MDGPLPHCLQPWNDVRSHKYAYLLRNSHSKSAYWCLQNAVVAVVAKAPLFTATPRAKARRILIEKGSPLFSTLWVFSLISVMATDTLLIMEQEGNGFNDTYKTSEGNTTLYEPMATVELPVNQRLLLGWSFGKDVRGLPLSMSAASLEFLTPPLFANFMHHNWGHTLRTSAL